VLHLNITLTATREARHTQYNKANGSIQLTQPYPIFEADTLIKISTDLISATVSINEQTPVTDKHFPCFEVSCQNMYC
jgi:hypothetical protein